jgi:type I restriction enzyme S subunit
MSLIFSKIKLGELGKVSMCKRILKHETSEFEEIPFYKISTFGGKADTFISREIYELYKHKYSYPKIGDILFSAAGTIGKTVIYDGSPAFFQDSNIVWIDNDETIILNRFLYYFYQTKPWITSKGSTILRLYNDNIRSIEINYPDIDIQEKISNVLSSLDSKIKLDNRINAELEAMAKTIYDYWFVQFDFPDKNGKPYKSSGGKMVWNEELKREIPDGWEKGLLSDLGEIIGGSTPSKAMDENFSEYEGISWITPKDLSINKGKKYISRGELNVTELGLKEASLKIMPAGTVLLSSRAPIGYLAISRTDVTTNQGFKSFVPKGNFTSEFIYYTIQNLIPEIEANSSGSTFQEVSTGTLKSIKTIIPQKEVLNLYSEKINPIFKKQDLLELENQQLAELRDWLLPMLMNGQVKVENVYEPEEHLNMVAEEREKYR